MVRLGLPGVSVISIVENMFVCPRMMVMRINGGF